MGVTTMDRSGAAAGAELRNQMKSYKQSLPRTKVVLPNGTDLRTQLSGIRDDGLAHAEEVRAKLVGASRGLDRVPVLYLKQDSSHGPLVWKRAPLGNCDEDTIDQRNSGSLFSVVFRKPSRPWNSGHGIGHFGFRSGSHYCGRGCTCGRCGGRGYIPRFRHVMNGICFKCLGRKRSGRR